MKWFKSKGQEGRKAGIALHDMDIILHTACQMITSTVATCTSAFYEVPVFLAVVFQTSQDWRKRQACRIFSSLVSFEHAWFLWIWHLENKFLCCVFKHCLSSVWSILFCTLMARRSADGNLQWFITGLIRRRIQADVRRFQTVDIFLFVSLTAGDMKLSCICDICTKCLCCVQDCSRGWERSVFITRGAKGVWNCAFLWDAGPCEPSICSAFRSPKMSESRSVLCVIDPNVSWQAAKLLRLFTQKEVSSFLIFFSGRKGEPMDPKHKFSFHDLPQDADRTWRGLEAA